MAPPGDSSCDGSVNQQISHRCGTGSRILQDAEEVTFHRVAHEVIEYANSVESRASVLLVLELVHFCIYIYVFRAISDRDCITTQV
jgi:hypothetical protein